MTQTCYAVTLFDQFETISVDIENEFEVYLQIIELIMLKWQ